MFNVKFSKIGWAIANNRALTQFIANKSSHLTPEEKRRGYIEIPLKDDRKLIITVGPDMRTDEERNQTNNNLQPA